MKKFLVLLCSILFIIGGASVAGAAYIYEVEVHKAVTSSSVDTATQGAYTDWADYPAASPGNPGSPGSSSAAEVVGFRGTNRTIEWQHSGISEPSYPVEYIKLTIIADDVDGAPSEGEQWDGYPDFNDGENLNGVSVGNGSYWVYLDDLTMLDSYSLGGPDLFDSGNDHLTTFEFTMTDEDVDGSLSDFLASTLYMKVDVEDWWECEIETSTLEVGVVPLPGAVWLLGSGLLGLAGARRLFR